MAATSETTNTKQLKDALENGNVTALLAVAYDLAGRLTPSPEELRQGRRDSSGSPETSRTQLRAVFNNVLRLEYASSADKVKSLLTIAQVRVNFLVEQATISPLLNPKGLLELKGLLAYAATVIRAGDTLRAGETVRRAKRLVELFRAMVAYHNLGARELYADNLLQARERVLTQNLSDNTRELVEKALVQGEGQSIQQLADSVITLMSQNNRFNAPPEFSRSQLRNVFTSLQSLELQPFDKKIIYQFQLIEPRLIYALSRQGDIRPIVEVLKYGLSRLFRDGDPNKAEFGHYVRLCQALIELQLHRKTSKVGETWLDWTDNTRQTYLKALDQNDGAVLVEQAQAMAGSWRGSANASSVTNNQLRNIYERLRGLADNKFDEADLQELAALPTTLRYVAARDKFLTTLAQNLEQVIELVFETKDVPAQRQRAEWLTDYFEAIIAYKTYGQELSALSATELADLDAALGTGAAAEVAAYNLAKKIVAKLKTSKETTSETKKDLAKRQLRKTFNTLKAAASSPLDPPQRRELWMTLPRLAYALASVNELEPIEKIVRTGLKKILLPPESKPEPRGDAPKLEPLADVLEAVLALYYAET